MRSTTRSGLVLSLLSVPFALLSCSRSDRDTIVRVSRQNNSGTYHYFREAVLGEERDYKLGSRDMSGSKDVVALVSKTPNAIGYSGMAYATDEVKMLKVSRKRGEAAYAPTLENCVSGVYPISRPLYIYTAGEPEGPVKHYLEWILSAEGQQVVQETGYVPNPTFATPSGTPTEETVSIQVDGSDTMINLAQAWSEAYFKQHPNVSIEVKGGGSGTGIAAMTDGKVSICNSSRAMSEEELARCRARTGKEPKQFVVGQDALAVYVHKDNPLDTISIEELAEIYGEGGSIVRWSQLGAAE